MSVSVGHYHTCAVLDDGSLKCWGNNGYGELGIGSTTKQNTPQPVSLGAQAHSCECKCGGTHTQVVADDGSLKCWGYNSYSQLELRQT